MLFSPNRIGNTYLGHRTFKLHQPIITTKWLTLFSLPLLPLGSFRVIVYPIKPRLIAFRKETKLRYQRLERVPLDLFQVFRIYAIISLNLALVVSVAWIIFH